MEISENAHNIMMKIKEDTKNNPKIGMRIRPNQILSVVNPKEDWERTLKELTETLNFLSVEENDIYLTEEGYNYINNQQ